MENLANKPPKSAMEFYTKLYCLKKSLSTKESSDIQEALKSWLLLSAADQEPFIKKFKKCQQDYEKRYAFYLKSVEPFMKKKPIRGEQSNDKCASETNTNRNDNNYFEGSTNMLHDTDDIICNKASSHDQTRATSMIEGTEPEIENQLQQVPEPSPPSMMTRAASTIEGTESEIDNQLRQVPEPSPPSMLNGKELFDAVNISRDNNLQWNDLSQIERGKYNRAVQSIKRDYINKYQAYLESLPSEELFQHYIRSREN